MFSRSLCGAVLSAGLSAVLFCSASGVALADAVGDEFSQTQAAPTASVDVVEEDQELVSDAGGAEMGGQPAVDGTSLVLVASGGDAIATDELDANDGTPVDPTVTNGSGAADENPATTGEETITDEGGSVPAAPDAAGTGDAATGDDGLAAGAEGSGTGASDAAGDGAGAADFANGADGSSTGDGAGVTGADEGFEATPGSDGVGVEGVGENGAASGAPAANSDDTTTTDDQGSDTSATGLESIGSDEDALVPDGTGDNVGDNPDAADPAEDVQGDDDQDGAPALDADADTAAAAATSVLDATAAGTATAASTTASKTADAASTTATAATAASTDADAVADTASAALAAPDNGWSDMGDGTWYYYVDGVRVTGQRKIGGKWYYFDPLKDGAMARGFVNLGSKTCYYGDDGAMRYGQQKIDGSWYYLTPGTGAMRTGFVELPGAGKTCYYDDQGRMQYGQRKVSGKWYYLRPGTGARAESAFVDLSSKTVYYGADGAMRYGQQKIAGSWYLFASKTGAMQTGFVDVPGAGKTCYYDDQGRMQYGQRKVAGKWYYLRPGTGAMARDVLVTLTGNFKVFGEMATSKNVYYCVDGSMIYGEVEVDGNWYYLEPKTGARAEDRFITHTAQQKTVYYDEWGVMARGGRMIGDRYYYFDETTGARKTAEDMAMWYPSGGMDAIAQGYWSGTENLILVDLDAHVTAVYEGSQGSWNQVRCMYCSVGAYETPTVTGVFEVGMRGYYFDSGYDRCFYFTQFYGDYLFHTILYAQTETPEYVNDGTLGAHVSHGCVRMLLEDAYYINSNIPSGTTVVVY